LNVVLHHLSNDDLAIGYGGAVLKDFQRVSRVQQNMKQHGAIEPPKVFHQKNSNRFKEVLKFVKRVR